MSKSSESLEKKVKANDDLRRAQLKTAAHHRAQFNYQVAMDRIDYTFDVINPAKAQVAFDATTKGELPEYTLVVEAVEVEDAEYNGQ